MPRSNERNEAKTQEKSQFLLPTKKTRLFILVHPKLTMASLVGKFLGLSDPASSSSKGDLKSMVSRTRSESGSQSPKRPPRAASGSNLSPLRRTKSGDGSKSPNRKLKSRGDRANSPVRRTKSSSKKPSLQHVSPNDMIRMLEMQADQNPGMAHDFLENLKTTSTSSYFEAEDSSQFMAPTQAVDKIPSIL